MSQDEFQALLQFFKVLADENRLKLLGILAQREHSVEELATLLHLKAPTISHHLARLRELDLVSMRTDGNTHYYWLNAEALRQKNRLFLTPEKMATLVENVDGDAWERKIVRDFFDGERLKELPTSVKKRVVILKWLAERFDYGVLYKEAQVNDTLKRYHPDVAYLRRELVGSHARFMQRDHNLYWRVPVDAANWHPVALRSRDRLPLQGWLGTPSSPGPHPTVLEVHEGPEVTQFDWLSPLAQNWLDAGFAYMVINLPATLKGSGFALPSTQTRASHLVNFDLTFLERIGGEPGHWELEDLLVARDWLLQESIADPKHILLTGWRYNAFIALLALARQPDLWAGAIVGQALVDWHLSYEEDPLFASELFNGTPGEKAERYTRCSPISYIEHLQVPLLLLQTYHDSRYTPTQARLLQERMRHHQQLLTLTWLDAPAAISDIELMVAQQQLIFAFARQWR